MSVLAANYCLSWVNRATLTARRSLPALARKRQDSVPSLKYASFGLGQSNKLSSPARRAFAVRIWASSNILDQPDVVPREA
jgi:hypothetical protein